MRTKTTLLLTAAIVAAGVASSMAQSNVYSLNIVGYVNVPVTGGAHGNFYLLNNPFDDGAGNNVTNVLASFNSDTTGTLFDGSAAFTFSPSGGYKEADYVGGVGWFPQGGFGALTPGSGFWLNIPAGDVGGTLTFTGSVVMSSTNNLFGNGTGQFNLVGSAYPASTNLVGLDLNWNADAQGGADHDGDSLFRWNSTTQNFTTSPAGEYDYVGGVGWFGPTGDTSGPVLNVAEGFFYLETQASGTWVQSFTVN